MTKYGLYGAGYFGAELGRIIKDFNNVEIVSVYDVEDRTNIAEELNSTYTDSFEEFFNNDMDAVIVASPNYLHKEPVLKAAEKGIHVFCEKPIALNYQDCKEMVDACKKNNVMFFAGHVMNFFNGIQKAKQVINNGDIGEILYCHSARNGWEEMQDEISWKKIRSKSGGHLYHHIHELDMIQFLMGVPNKVVMRGGNVAHKGPGFGDEDDLLLITLEFKDDRYALLEYGSAFRKSEHYLLIQGTKGYIKIDMHDVEMIIKTIEYEEKHLVHETKEEDEDRTAIYNSTLMDGAIMYGKPEKKPPMWLHSIMKKEMKLLNELMSGYEVPDEFKPLLDGTAAMNSIATADALTLSLKEDKIVRLEEIVNS